jgi:hypothetical protein
MPDSPSRHSRLLRLLRERRGLIGIADLKRALADHVDDPTGVCRHQREVQTIASIIAEPDKGLLHVAAGHPCTEPFTTFEL